jgi:broad specificity phosphatase PhoE
VIWLVRHGATPWTGRRYLGMRDLPLSALGYRQARALGLRFARERASVQQIIASPLRRALETAYEIARLGIELHVDSRLREVDLGDAEGLSFDDLCERWPLIAADLLRGEPPLAVARRGAPGAAIRAGQQFLGGRVAVRRCCHRRSCVRDL